MADDLHNLYLSLGFRDNRLLAEAAWLAFVQKFLVDRTSATAGTKRRDSAVQVEIEGAVVAFVEAYGKALWPAKAAERQHLQHPRVRGQKRKSFAVVFDGKMSRVQKRTFRQYYGGSSPTPDQEIARSRIGVQLAKYFRAVLEDSFPEDAEHADLQTLLQTILGTGSGKGGASTVATAAMGPSDGGGDASGSDDEEGEVKDGNQEDDGEDGDENEVGGEDEDVEDLNGW